MKIILKDIPRLDNLFDTGESQDHYDKRRVSKEDDSYLLTGNDQDITSIENWVKYCSIINSDEFQTRSYVSELFRWDNNPTDEEIDIAIDFFVMDPTKTFDQNNINKATYLALKGDTDPAFTLRKKHAHFHGMERASCKARADSEAMTAVISKYLSLIDSIDFVKVTNTLIDLYKNEGVRGTEDGNTGEGIFNFIESTVGTTYEFAGLEQQGYVLLTGTWSDFRTEIMDILRKGNY